MKIFGYEIQVKIIIASNKPEARVVNLIDEAMKNSHEEGVYRKIEMIKILRRYDVSKILIDAGLVPASEIMDKSTEKPYVGLAFAKTWIESHYK